MCFPSVGERDSASCADDAVHIKSDVHALRHFKVLVWTQNVCLRQHVKRKWKRR